MRLSLAPGRASCRPGEQDRTSPVGGKPSLRRAQAAFAAETVRLVLGEDSPLPDTAADVEDLARRLRGHVSQLGALAPARESALLRAQQLCAGGLPEGYMPSRVHLVRLAEATQELISAVQPHGDASAQPARGRRWWKPPVNVLRGSVFALALACLVLAASVPRT
ncbi:DUF6415 family natural product biosynthesis protein [Streptomyces sp. NPDC023723]|uniref:DUF6415 family natural product biosynthesis protein n=1 Tax=Streptomyces sp. NPDC023723 TaxID=3154323 RepID=UPI0033D0BDF7